MLNPVGAYLRHKRVDTNAQVVVQVVGEVDTTGCTAVVGHAVHDTLLVPIRNADKQVATLAASRQADALVHGQTVAEYLIPVGLVEYLPAVLLDSGVVFCSVGGFKVGTAGVDRIGSSFAVGNAVAPAQCAGWRITAIGPLAKRALLFVLAVDAVHAYGVTCFHAVAFGVGLALFGGDHDHAVGGTGSPNSRCRSAFQHFDGGNVVGVQVVQTALLHHPVDALAHAGVAYGNTVDYNQRLQAAGDGRLSPNLDKGARTGVAGVSGDGNTRAFTGKALDDSTFARLLDASPRNTHGGNALFVFAALDTQSRNGGFSELTGLGGIPLIEESRRSRPNRYHACANRHHSAQHTSKQFV